MYVIGPSKSTVVCRGEIKEAFLLHKRACQVGTLYVLIKRGRAWMFRERESLAGPKTTA